MSKRPELTTRPASAIYLGDPLDVLDGIPNPLFTPLQSPLVLASQLPSPPHTNSTSGSTGDRDSSGSGSIRLAGAPLESLRDQTMLNGRSRLADSTSTLSSDHSYDDEEGEHTARLSDERRDTSSSDNASARRALSLADRNRQVLDKLAAISSHTRGSPSISTLRTKTPNSTSGSLSRSTASQHSFSRTAEDQEISDNERVAYSYTSDDRSITPPATARRVVEISPRQRLVSEPTSPRHLRLMSGGATTILPSPSRRPPVPSEFERSPPPPESSRRSPTLSRRPRQPLPKEFTFSRTALDARSPNSSLYPSELASPAPIQSATLAPRPSSRATSRSPGVYMTRGSPSPTAGAATFSEQITRRPQRPATVRERRSTAHRSWQSEDLNSPDTETESSRPPGSRYEQHGESVESPVVVRSVVNEGLRAAGLAGRREAADTYRTADGLGRRQRKVSGGLSSLVASPTSPNQTLDWDTGPDRKNGTSSREPLANRLSNRSIQSILSPRPGTGMSLIDEGARPSQQLRHLRSNTDLPDRHSSLGSAAVVKAFTSPSGVVRTLPSKREIAGAPQSNGVSTNSNTTHMEQHAHLMNEALFMFESHVQKLPRASVMPGIYDDVVRDAQVLVAAAGSLNRALRAASNVAVEEQVQAEVSDNSQDGEVAEVWGKIGQELREDVRVSDELVRTMTSFMIGVGRMLRSAALSTTALGDGRQSVDGRRSVESGGRRSVEVRTSIDHRDESLRRLTASRPPTADSASGSGTIGGDWDRSKRASYGSIIDSRPPSVLSMIQDRRPFAEMPDRPATYTALGSGKRSLSRAREKDLKRLPIPQSAKELGFPELTDGGDRTPIEGPVRSLRHSLAVPPPLPTLPSETLIRSKPTVAKLVPKEKRSSRGPTAIVRGQATMPTSPSEASIGLSPTTATSTGLQASPPKRPFTLAKVRGTSALNGLQQVATSLGRKRTISASSGVERSFLSSPPSSTRPPILKRASSSLASGAVTSPTSATSRMIRTTSSSTLSGGSGGGKSSDAAQKKTRAARVRMSLDSSLHSEGDATNSLSLSTSQRRERRYGTDSYS